MRDWRRSVIVFVLLGSFSLPSPAFADHLQGRHLESGETVQAEGEFFAGEKLAALFKRLLEADAMEEKIQSLEATITLQEAELKEFRERRDLTEAQRRDFDALQKSYELHLQIYRDAIKVYRESISDLTAQIKLMIETNKAMGDELKKVHRELFWTRALGVLSIIGVVISAIAVR